MRGWQQLSASKDPENAKKAKADYLHKKTQSAIVKYLNDAEQARVVGEEGEGKAPVLTLSTFSTLYPEEGSELYQALKSFEDACKEFSNNIREAALAKNTKGGSAKNVLEFAEDRSKIVELFSAVITACLVAFVAYEKDLISLAKFGKNSEGAKLGLTLLGGMLAGGAAAGGIAHMCINGDSEAVKTNLAGIQKECNKKADAFKALATQVSEERVVR